MFLIRGAGLLNVMREAQIAGKARTGKGGPGACSPGKTDALRSILVQSEPIYSTLH